MEWIKIKIEHISPLYTSAQVGCLVRYQLMVARLQRLPTSEEVQEELGGMSLVYLKKNMTKVGVSLDYIGTKVLEDCDYLVSIREANKLRKRKQRLKIESHVGQVGTVPTPIREDKIYKTNKIRHTKYGELENVKLTPEEYQKLVDLMGEKNVRILILDLDTYIASKGVRYKSHYATIQSWARRKNQEMQNKSKGKRILSA